MCLVILSLFIFAERGPIRGLGPLSRNFNDFVSPYVQARAWLAGKDPFVPSTLDQSWPSAPPPPFLDRESLNGSLPARRGIPSPYLLAAFPILLPVSELPYPYAIVIWICISVAAAALAVWSCSRLSSADRRPEWWAIIAASALLAPLQTAIALSNIFTLVLGLGMLATYLLRENKPAWAGVLLAISAALKATVALPFLILALFHSKRWKVTGTAAVTATFLFLVAIAPTPHHTLWSKSFVENSSKMFGAGAINDFSTANPLRFQLINLQVAFFPLWQSRIASDALAWGIFALLLAFWARALLRDHCLTFLDLAILASACLIPVYHRFTDAGLLLIPVVWAISELRGKGSKFAGLCLLLLVPFVLPGAAILYELTLRNPLLQQMSQTRFWQSFGNAHEAWLILAVSIVLITVRYRRESKLPLLDLP